MLHLGTKKYFKKYILDKKSQIISKKAKIGFFTIKIFATCFFEIFFSKIVFWTKTVLYRPFPLAFSVQNIFLLFQGEASWPDASL